MRQIDLCEVCEQIIYLKRGRWHHESGFHWHRAKPKPVAAQIGKSDYLHPAYSEASPLPMPVEEIGDAAGNLISFAAGVLATSQEAEPERHANYVEPSQPWPTSEPVSSPIELEAPEPPSSNSSSDYDCGSSSDSSSSCDSGSSDCGCGGSSD